MAEAHRGFLGLTHNPFVQSDEGFFEQADRKTHLEQLRHLSQWSRRVLLVTGPPGMGKSMLYRQLSATLEPRCKAARIHGSLVNASREVLVSVAQGFGIAAPADANGQLLTSLIERHVDEQSAAERICVVMVDDADLLEPRAVVDLMSLAQACSLQLVLFGEVKLVPAIERSAGRLGLGWHEIRLNGFNQQQTREYLEWRFQQARYRGRLPFTESQVQEIQRLSEGMPGKINQMANVLLVKLETGDIGKSASAFPAVHRALLVLLLVMVGLVYLLWLQNENVDEAELLVLEQTVPEDPDVSVAELGTPVRQDPARELPRPPFPSAVDPRQPAMRNIASQPADGDPFGQQAAPAAGARELEDELAAIETDQVRSSEDEQTADGQESRTAEFSRETVDTPITQPRGLQPLEPQPVPDPEPNPGSGPAVSVESAGIAPDEPAADLPAAVVTPAIETVVANVQPEPEQPQPQVDEPLAVEVSEARDVNWLLSQPGGNFTLQLVTVSSAERALAFIDKQSNREQFATYELERDGRRLHVVVYGNFASRADAETASRRLPASVGNVQPWIRTMEQVHGAIYTVR